MKSKRLKTILLFGLIACIGCLSGCVDQSQGDKQNIDKTNESNTNVTDDNSDSDSNINDNVRIAATSIATVNICEKLNLELVGVPESSLYSLPERYKDLPTLGNAMSVDMEKLSQIKPDWILSPVSLISDLKPKYESQGYQYAFLNLNSVEGMYKSIKELGELFDREKEADALISDFTEYYDNYQKKHGGEEEPSVLILMGLPGSYVVATEKSYVGSLVKMAGGKNVYADEEKDFVNISPEDMLEKKPDIILRTAHAMPDDVMKMFAKEFETNDIWKHFDSVKNGKVYDLSYKKFGMSANFEYKEAIEELENYFYGQTNEVK